MAKINEVIIRPLLTEKTSLQTEKFNKYGFVVRRDCTKFQIKNAIETLYDVKVNKVWTSISPGKTKRAGRHIFKTSKVKKALVQIDQGQKIEFFKGV